MKTKVKGPGKKAVTKATPSLGAKHAKRQPAKQSRTPLYPKTKALAMPSTEELFGGEAMSELGKSMENLVNMMKVLPWLPSFLVFAPVVITALTAIILFSGQWDMLVYLLEALIVGLIVALVVRYTVGHRMEKKLMGGLRFM